MAASFGMRSGFGGIAFVQRRLKAYNAPHTAGSNEERSSPNRCLLSAAPDRAPVAEPLRQGEPDPEPEEHEERRRSGEHPGAVGAEDDPEDHVEIDAQTRCERHERRDHEAEASRCNFSVSSPRREMR
jgi:hypothetical protein